LSDEIRGLARQILDIIPLVMRTVAAELRQGDHSAMAAPHFRMLWILEHRAWSLSELAEHQSVSLPTMSNSVTILEERGWVRRTRSSEDRRKVVIELTDEGHLILAQAREKMEDHIAEAIQLMSQDEQLTVSDGLRILRDSFKQLTDKECKHQA
jgi:DNA-binding MarR family transcriptional regulator